MKECVIIASNGKSDFFLTAETAVYLDALTNKKDQVFEMCWSAERDDARSFTVEEVKQVLLGVESILMVPDPDMRWEYK